MLNDLLKSSGIWVECIEYNTSSFYDMYPIKLLIITPVHLSVYRTINFNWIYHTFFNKILQYERIKSFKKDALNPIAGLKGCF